MPDPIYPDKTKTGLAALKPLTDVFFESEESVNRWQWQIRPTDCKDCWDDMDIDNIFMCCHTGDRAHCVRLTPKPRRVWIGDQSYPEPLSDLTQERMFLADVMNGVVIPTMNMGKHKVLHYIRRGFVFPSSVHAQQCLDAYRKARRVE